MNKTKKKFDCVEMKNRIQQKQFKDYIGSSDQFETFDDFIEQRIKENAWCRQAIRRIKSSSK